MFTQHNSHTDKGLTINKTGQISSNLSLYRLVENRGVKSHYFGEDLDVTKMKKVLI